MVKELRWYAKDIADVEREMGTDVERGLTNAEAEARRLKYGPNSLREAPGRTIWQMLADQFKEILVLILLAAALISGLLGEIEDSLVILLIVVLNAILGVVQENRAEKSLAALKKLSAPMARVKREGKVMDIPASEIVPGDIIILEAGANIPCDSRIIEAANLKVEEAALTGESVPVEKTSVKLDDGNIGVGDRINMVFLGTTVTYGRGSAIAVKTGMDTEIGKIAEMIQSVPRETTPMQKKLDEVGKVLGSLALALVIIVFFAGILRGEPGFEMFMTSVSLAVAAIPEGLPAVVTIVLALGVQRMAQRNAIIRKLPAVETLGTATVIASDKTGTLTQNEMTVVRLYYDGREIDVTGKGYMPQGEFIDRQSGEKLDPCGTVGLNPLLLGGMLVNDARIVEESDNYLMVGDPTEGSLVVAAMKSGFKEDEVKRAFPRVAEIPFDSNRKRMTTFHKVNIECLFPEALGFVKGSYAAFTKGGPDLVLACCNRIFEGGTVKPLTDAKREELLNKNLEMASDALRILAVACRNWDELPCGISAENVEKDLIFIGFEGMIDPARPEAKDAVAVAKRAGIIPIMVTGDHKATAAAIARELGIMEEGDRVISGEELDSVSDGELEALIEDVRVFARVSPEHKVRIVTALKNKGHIAAMTGDGVNDAPALKRADIGVAMGITGTDVSKEAADMVLADDNFATIVAAIREGRAIFSNIKKAIHYLLSCNIGEIASIFASIVFGLGRPLTAIQILYVNLVTDGLPALALGVDPPEEGIMEKKPRDPKAGIFSGGMLGTIGLYGLFIGLSTLAIYYLTTRLGWGGIEKARTMAFATLAFSQLFHAFSSRSATKSIFTLGVTTNRSLVLACLISALLQVVVLTIPQLEAIFDTVPLTGWDWLMIAVFSVVPFVLVEITKIFKRLRGAEE